MCVIGQSMCNTGKTRAEVIVRSEKIMFLYSCNASLQLSILCMIVERQRGRSKLRSWGRVKKGACKKRML